MEDQPITTKKISLSYGLILGITSVIFSVILYVLNMHMEQGILQSVVGILIIAVIVIMGISKFKHLNGNVLTLGQALKTGLGIAAIGALIAIIYNLIFMYIIEPDFLSQMMDVQREAMLEQNPNMTEEQLAGAQKMMGMFSSVWFISIVQMISTLFISFIVALIAGLVMKNDK